MFQRFLSWVKEWISKMIGKSNIKNALNIDVEISAAMAEKLQLWSLMYENQAPWLNADTKSLNLPASIASEIARSVTIEMEVTISGSARAKFIQEQIEPVVEALRKQVEYGVAKGGLMMKPFISGKAIHVDFVQADQFYPVAFDSSGKITSCVFADQRTMGKDYYTRLELHQMTKDGCEIKNVAFKSSTRETLGQRIQLDEVDDWKDLEDEATIKGIDRPLYGYFKYPLTNNVDVTSPLGISCFARAENLIEQADKQWSNLLWEFEAGQTALYADELAFGKDTAGKPILPFKRLYRSLDMGGQADNLFEEWSPTLREQNILNGLNAMLKRIEFTCGLAYGTLSDPAMVDKTATEIMSAKQRSAATIVDNQKALQVALDDLIYAMDKWSDIGKLAARGKFTTEYNFDDSLVVDSQLQSTQDLQLVTAQIMSKLEYRMRNFHEDEATAAKNLALIKAEQPAEQFPGE